MEEGAVSRALAGFRATLDAAVREVHVDISAFKQQVEHRMDELRASSRPLSDAVARLQEENLQLRARLDALSRAVGELARARGPENGHDEAEPPDWAAPEPDWGGSGHAEVPGPGSNDPGPAPWRLKRHADTNWMIRMVASQAELLPRQAELLPRQAELLPRQAELLPRQAELLPRQAELLPRQAELLPR
ncbi:PREDICTED: titin-like [Poecilia mexicana]|uniref:titin-like n=1 Tax=Poecilia mexicana TaxID=48701 RepID=UPI00072EDD8E|nr:PREDICTED: titin-like [Poecilia mexicana]